MITRTLWNNLTRGRATLLALCGLAFAGTTRAQYNLKAGTFNHLFQGPLPSAPLTALGTPTIKQFRGVAYTTGSSGPRKAALPRDRSPRA